jgi:hypothetical protein
VLNTNPFTQNNTIIKGWFVHAREERAMFIKLSLHPTGFRPFPVNLSQKTPTIFLPVYVRTRATCLVELFEVGGRSCSPELSPFARSSSAGREERWRVTESSFSSRDIAGHAGMDEACQRISSRMQGCGPESGFRPAPLSSLVKAYKKMRMLGKLLEDS